MRLLLKVKCPMFVLDKTGTVCGRLFLYYLFLSAVLASVDSWIPGSALSCWRANFLVKYEPFYVGRQEVASCEILNIS